MPEDFPGDRELQRILAGNFAERSLEAGGMDIVGLALEADEPLGKLVKALPVPADIAEERNGFMRDPRSLGDQRDNVLHLWAQLLDFVEVDCARRGEHF